MKFDKCGVGFTGYVVKAKNIYYYKCRTNGCKCNLNAKRLNGEFKVFLESNSIKEEYIAPPLKDLAGLYKQRNKDDSPMQQELNKQLIEVNSYIENIDEND